MPFTRRYNQYPSAAELVKVAGVVIVDAPPTVPTSGAPFGKICVVGELEDGPFNTPTDLLSSSDQQSIFGTFGYAYATPTGTSKYQNASAKASGGTEAWNGNVWLQTTKLKFRALTLCRVDTSIGTVTLTPRAYVQGTLKAPFAMSNGLTFPWTRDGVAKTYTAAAASGTTTSAAGTFTSFVGGEILTLSIDGGANFNVTFQPGDNTLALVITRINTVFGQTIASNSAGQLKLTSPTAGTGSSVVVTAGVPATTLGLTAGTYAGSGDAVNIAAMTLAEFTTKIQGVDAGTAVTTGTSLANAGFPRIVSTTNGTGTIQINGGTGNAALGFVAGAAATTAALPLSVNIPAGTRCSAAGANRVVTMVTTAVPAASTTSTTIKVRPAVDDGTYPGVAGATLVTLEDKPGDLEWGLTQPLLLTAALTATQLDSAYLTAIAACVGVGNNTTKRINGIVSARQSNVIRGAIFNNAISASANGHFGRRAFICAPVGSTAATIIGAAAPGVGAYRDETCSSAAGDANCFLQELIDGGYSTTGTVLRHADTMLASRWSTLNPGYNPGQIPEDPTLRWDTTTFFGLGQVAAGWDINTYAAFKVAGVCGLEFDKDVGMGFEQGITTIDPTVDTTRTDVSRKTLVDYISDSLTNIAKVQTKRQGTTKRRDNLKDTFDGFITKLLGDTVAQFVTSYTTDGQPVHVVRYDFNINPIQSDDVIVFNMRVGPNAVAVSKG